MNQLIEGVLPIRSGLAPIDRSRLAFDLGSFQRHVFAIAFHR